MIKEILSLMKYQFADVARTKWIFIYALFFFLFVSALLKFGSDPSKTAASILNIVLMIVPMISILYASIYWYNSESFMSLLLTQPIRRSSVLLSNWLSVSLGLAGSFTLSTLAALIFNNSVDSSSLMVLLFGGVLTFIFVGLGLLISVTMSDRMKGVGLAFLVWLYFSVLHDAVVFTFMSFFRDYPIEIPSMFLMASNPIDLARVEILLTLDLSAMMGYTGKILQQTLSGASGFGLLTGTLALWIAFPVILGLRFFSKKNL